MSRRRYQRGRLFIRGVREKVWVGRWREDVIGQSGEIQRPERSVVLGSIKDYPTKSLARRALDLRIAEVNALGYRAKPLATIKQFVVRWDSTVLPNHKPSTQLGVRSVLKLHILPALGEIQMKDLDAETVQRFISSIELSAKSVRNIYITLRMVWKSARAWGYVARDHDPFDSLVLPKRGPRRALSFTLDEVQRILAAADEPYKTLYWLAAETGMRAGELAGLTIDDIDLSLGVGNVRQSVWRGKIQTPKSINSVRTFAVSVQLAAHLRRFMLTWRPNDKRLIFTSCNGTPWDCNMLVKRKFGPLLDRLGIQRCGLQAFRHAVASLMDRLSVPMATRQSRLGHSDPAMTLGVYTHAVGADDRRFAEQIGELLSGANPPMQLPVAPNLRPN